MKYIYILICLLVVDHAKSQTIIMQATFDNDSLPLGWTIDSAGVMPVNKWKFTGPPTGITGQGFDAHYPRLYDNISGNFNCSLTTDTFNTAAYNNIYLSYSSQCTAGQNGGSYTFPTIEISNDNGNTWLEAFKTTVDNYPIKRNILDITSFAAGSSLVKIRFRFITYNEFNRWWAIDSIVVSDSMPCISPPDSGTTECVTPFVCTGSPAQLYIGNLSRGIGQTYQWQLNNAASGNVYTNIAGAIYDTVTVTQNSNTYYQCIITCGGLSTNSMPLLVKDTPVVANAYSDNIHLCAGRDDTLRLYAPYGGVGIGWQWQYSSSGGGPYTDIAGATSDTYIVSSATYMNSTFFDCKQICLSNATSKAGFWVNEVPNPHPMCYCYPWNNNPCGNNYYLSNFEIQGTSLNNNTICVDTLVVHWNNNNYQFFDPAFGFTTATLTRNTIYNLSMTTANQAQRFQIWIDYDHNGNFDVNEWTSVPYSPANIPVIAPVTIPANAVPGQTGLRIRTCRTCLPDSSNTCGTMVGGTTHDYIVTIDTTVSVSGLQSPVYDVEVYPNPATKELTVSSGSRQVEGSIYITDITGKSVFEAGSRKPEAGVKLDISALRPGIYFVKLQSAKGMTVKKFIKQ